MIEFSVNSRERKDTPCGYPKSFRRVALSHTVKDVFYTNDAYDKFIAIGKGISYSDDFVNGYWHNAIYRAAVNTEFVSGCHFSTVDIEINIIICDNGEYQYSFDGTTWYDGGRFCSGLYNSGWSCICSNAERVVIVNSKYQKVGESGSMSAGVGVCGTWDTEKEEMVWKEISLPFPSSSIKYFNGYFYIYGQVESTGASVTIAKPAEGEAASLNKIYYDKISAGETQIVFSEVGGFYEGTTFNTYVIEDGREMPVESNAEINGEQVTITLTSAPETTSAYSIHYKVPALTYTLTFTSTLDGEIQDIIVHAVTGDGSDFEVKNCTISKTGTENEYSITAICENYDSVVSFDVNYYSLSSNIADIEQSAISDNGVNFCTNEDSFASEAGSFICEAAYGRGIYMAVTTEGNAIYSTQTPSRNWSSVKSLESKNCKWNSITFVCGMFVVCGVDSGGSYVMYCSYNTTDWIKVDFSATDATNLADVTAYPVRLINCRGTLIATAVTPYVVNGEVVELGDEKGFFACDTYISIEEEAPVQPEIEEGDTAYEILMARLTAAENRIRSLESELANRPEYNQYKGNITSQEQFDNITAGDNNIVGDTYNLTCPIAYVTEGVLYQSDFYSFLYNDESLEIWNEYNLVRDEQDNYLWTLTWDPATVINSTKITSVLSTSLNCSCSVYNNSNLIMSGAIAAVDSENGVIKIKTADKYESLQNQIVWTSIVIDNRIETYLPVGTNIIWNGNAWDDASKNDTMSNYTTVSQTMKMIVYGTADIYNDINEADQKTANLTQRMTTAENNITSLDELTAYLSVNTPEIYTKETIEGMNAITGMKHGDMCIILSGNTSAQSIYRYYTKNINGVQLSTPQWVWLTDLSLFAPQPVLELTAEFTDDGIYALGWDYSKGNTAKTSGDFIELFYINNVKSGDYGVIDDYGGCLNNFRPGSDSRFPDSYAPPPDWDYLAPNANQHYRYSFFYDGSKFDWNRSVRNNE